MLNSKQNGVIILVMQRLHQEDLVGEVLERESWKVLSLRAIAQEDESYLPPGRDSAGGKCPISLRGVTEGELIRTNSPRMVRRSPWVEQVWKVNPTGQELTAR